MRGSADGTGTARFNGPSGPAVDSTGTIYVADFGNSIIRKVTDGGVVTTLAGTAGMRGSADGTGAAARFTWPYGPYDVALDSRGNVYVTDLFEQTIRRITPIGSTTTVPTITAVGVDARTFLSPMGLATLGDSIVISNEAAILLLRHGAQ